MPRLRPQRLPIVSTLFVLFAALAATLQFELEALVQAADDARTTSSTTKSAEAIVFRESRSVDHAYVAGFERFFGHAGRDRSSLMRGGLLLLGELNCTSCHAAEGPAAMTIDAKQAPLLGEVAARANPLYLKRFILDPHSAKPGATMPNLLAGVERKEAEALAEAITHYLASIATTAWRATGPDMSASARGEELFHKVGCVACHAPRREATSQPGTSAAAAVYVESDENRPPIDLELASVPLSRKLHEKYSITGLAQFLLVPLAVRPGGRMPRLSLTHAEAIDLAHYLLRDTKAAANLQLAYYEGNWSDLPDFDKLEPKLAGPTSSFSLGPFKERSKYALRYDGFLNIATPGEYTFYLHSDDGSRLYLDGRLLIDHGGIHGGETKEGKVRLSAGLHPIRVTFFQAQGGAELFLFYSGPRLKRQPVPSSVLTASAKPLPGEEPFEVDAALAAKGREAFLSVGCASCHQLTDSPAEKNHRLPALPLVKVRREAGCLSGKAATGRPFYALNSVQRQAITAALDAIQQAKLKPPTAQDQVAATMTALNCFACHRRADVGGVIRERNPYFTANSPDLGDEGRIPPLLTGVGEKLQSDWLRAVLTESAVARPYMDARMPQFGEHNLRELAALLTEVDRSEFGLPQVADSPADAKNAGFALVGKEGLTCISCHMFNRHKSLGIQAMDLTLMHQRLRPEWFHRYMLNPSELRPGTRMPQAFIDGRSSKVDVLDGDADRQIHALWQYLADGRRAKQPEGLIAEGGELIVGGEAVIYRAFIDGAGTRGIGVGYPAEVNLAFDANAMRPAMIWKGRFIDASKHWTGRGEGFQPPAGDDVRKLVEGPPFALLADKEERWPTEIGKQAGYRFRGYRLDELRRPTFLYDFGTVRIEDFFEGQGEGDKRHLVRAIRFIAKDGDRPLANLYHRSAAQAAMIDSDGERSYSLEQYVTLLISKSGGSPFVRESGSVHELLTPIEFHDGEAWLTIAYHW
jgi:mono/diheme cytochrome c family protein